jgi:2'-hydroxyisoflavone reductase
MDRRDFLRASMIAVGGGIISCSGGNRGGGAGTPTPAPADAGVALPKGPLDLLILGGTAFLGPEFIEAALARGHKVTLFNRGKTNPQLFPDLEKLRGDRDGQLDALAGRKWHAVVDTSGYVPRIVKMSAELLAPNVDHYVFISTISVYKDMAVPGADETAAVAELTEPGSEDVPKFYGALKALCEQAAEAAMPGRVTNIRPGLIVGPGDPTGRYTYWPTRIARGGEILAPGPGTDPVQMIDVRDLAEWMVRVIEQRVVGTYNALGPAKTLTMAELLDGTRAGVAARDAKFTWVDAAFLEQEQVAAWQEMPVWIPPEGEYAGAGTTSNARAVAKGLTFRPVADTARATLDWFTALPADKQATYSKRAGLAPDKEQAVLKKWAARPKQGTE